MDTHKNQNMPNPQLQMSGKIDILPWAMKVKTTSSVPANVTSCICSIILPIQPHKNLATNYPF